MTIEELIERSHAMAVDKGWWPEVEQRSVVEQVNNFHAEISKAWEEYRAGRIDTWWSDEGFPVSSDEVDDSSMIADGFKPEGFWIEIADLCIRLADTIGAYGWNDAHKLETGEPRNDIPLLVAALHVCLIDLIQVPCDGSTIVWDYMAPSCAWQYIRCVIQTASVHNIDLLALCELKMAYNATLAHRHGGKLA